MAGGLKRILADVPLKAGYAEAIAGWSGATGAFGRLEAGAHVLPGVSAFAYGQVDRGGPGVGIGARYEWSW